VKFLLTSAGIKNASIHNTLGYVLGKPLAEANALCILTAVLATHGSYSAGKPLHQCASDVVEVVSKTIRNVLLTPMNRRRI